MEKKTTYFKIISHFGKQRDDYSNVIMIVETSIDFKQWTQIYKSSDYKQVINWLASMILVNELNNYHILADFKICSDVLLKIVENKEYYEKQKQNGEYKGEYGIINLPSNCYGEKFNYGDEDDDDDSVIFSESEKSSPLQSMSIDKLICIIHAQTDYIKMLQTHSGELLDMLTNNLVEAVKQEK